MSTKHQFEESIAYLLQGKSLSEKNTEKVFLQLFRGKLSEDEAKTLLLLLAKKGETVDEVVGCLKAIKRLEPPIKTSIPNIMDTCGTGGDGSHSFNISTVSAFVIAGAGGKVAKHGNRAISSNSGSSDLMKALGVKLDAPKERMIQSIKQNGIGYFHAPFYHPVFAKVQPLRQKLKVRTIFNLLGPLLNPLGVKRQIVGVGHPNFLKLYPRVLKRMSMSKVFICHSEDGLDEISLGAKTKVVQISKQKMSSRLMNPESLGLKKAHKRKIKGGNAEANKKTAIALLNNEVKGPLKDIILLNAGAGLCVAGIAKNTKQGIGMARKSLEEGHALKALRGLVATSNK